jgi:putative chitinase
MVANANLLKKCNECSESFLKDTPPASAPTTPKSGPFYSEESNFVLLTNNPCIDSLTKLASKPFEEFVVKLNLLEKIPTKVQEALYKIKTEIAAKKPTVDLSEIFKSDYPNNFDIGNVAVLLNGKQVKLSSFNLGKNGDYVLDIKDWSTETQAKDKILFGGAANSTDKILAIEASTSAISDVKSYLKVVKELTGKQLKEIFPSTSQARCDEVAELINKYAVEYGLTSNEWLAHFIGQIGAESNLSDLKEFYKYSSKDRIKEIFGKVKYCDLFEGYEADLSKCNDERPMDCVPPLTAITSKLVIKDKYVNSKSLFDYTYSCRMDNGPTTSGDGSRFRGRGFMHLTGRDKYTILETNWNATFPNNKKDFLCDTDECDANRELLVTNLDFAMRSSLAFWKNVGANDLANMVTNTSIEKVSTKVNGGAIGIETRKSLTKKAYNILK